MSIFHNNMLQGVSQVTGGFSTSLIPNSVFFDGTNDYLSKTLGFTSDRKKAIIGVWLQRTRFATSNQVIFGLKQGGSNSNPSLNIGFDNTDYIYANDYNGGTLAWRLNVVTDSSTTRFFRDDSWFHFIASYDTSHAVAQERFKIFINGVNIPIIVAASDGTFYSLNDNIGIANSDRDTVWMEGYHASVSQKIQAYCAQPFLLDGKSIQAGDVAISDILDTFTFGTNGSQIIPKATSDIATLANTAGGISHVFSFEDSSALGNDASTNNNDFDLESIASGDQTTNTPSKTYPIWSARSNNLATSAIGLSNGNRTIDDVNPAGVSLNWWPQTGKWYFEAVGTTFGGSNVYLGIYEQTAIGKRVSAPWDETTGTHQWIPGTTSGTGGQAENNNTLTNYAGGAVTSNGTRIAFAYDMDNRKCYYGTISGSTITWKNSGDPTSGATGTGAAPYSLTSNMDLIPVHLTAGTDSQWTYYFESSNWAAAAPTDYKEVHTGNLTTPEYQGIDYFDTTLYEGNGTNQRVGDFVPFTDVHTVDKSAMFQHDDIRCLSRTVGTPSSTGGKIGTWSVWYKTGLIDTDCVFFDSGTTATNRTSIQMDSGGQIIFSHSGTTILSITADMKGGGIWRHLVVKADTSQGTAANRLTMYMDGVEITAFGTDARAASFAQDAELGYLDSGSTQFVGSYDGSSANQWDGYLAEVAFLDNQALAASSFGEVDTSTNRWVPKVITGLTYGNQGFYLEFEGTFGNQAAGVTPTDVSSAGTHSGDIANLTDGNYGATGWRSNVDPSTNVSNTTIGFDLGSAKTVNIIRITGRASTTGNYKVQHSDNNTVWTDTGTTFTSIAITTTANSGVLDFTSDGAGSHRYWRLVNISVASGSSAWGFREIVLAVKYGAGDSTGNTNHLTEGGASTWVTTDQSIDTPTKNYAILDFPIGNPAFSLGNLRLTGSGSDYDRAYATLPVSKGKWYCEFKFVSGDDAGMFGIVRDDTRDTDTTSVYIGQQEHQYGISFEAKAFNDAGELFDGTNYDAADFGLLAFDIDNGKLFLGRRDVSGTTTIWYDSAGANNGNPATGASPTYTISNATSHSWRIGCSDYGGTVIDANFGTSDFAVTIPSGFNELNQDNLDGTADLLTDFAWIKNRDEHDSHMWFDRVRGVGKVLKSEAEGDGSGAAETTSSTTLTRFLQRGVEIGTDVNVNTAGESYVLWQWLGGGTAATSSPAGTIASTVITSAPKHLSLISFTGTGSAGTVGHGLGAAPDFVLAKLRDQQASWLAYINTNVVSDPETDFLVFQAGGGLGDNTHWNDTAPTSSVISVGGTENTNKSSGELFFWAFRSVPGVCRVGTYYGNSNADGPYIALGFRPAFLITKWISAGGRSDEYWGMIDNKRKPNNGNTAEQWLSPATADDEGVGSSHLIDFYANGFKFVSTGGQTNQSAGAYMYLAMADIAGGGDLPPVYGA